MLSANEKKEKMHRMIKKHVHEFALDLTCTDRPDRYFCESNATYTLNSSFYTFVKTPYSENDYVPFEGILEAAWSSGWGVGLEYGGLVFKPHSRRLLEFFLGSPEFNSSAALVNSHLVCLLVVGVLIHLVLCSI